MATIRSGATERLILCAWGECDRPAQDSHITRVPDGRVSEGGIRRTLHYGFCCERHQELWKHSHRDLGRLPLGARGLLPPR